MRINVYVPDELVEAARRRHPSYNASGVFQEALRRLSGCAHRELSCRSCGEELVADVLGRRGAELLFSASVEALEVLMVRGGTVEGAIRVVFEVARRRNVRLAFSTPLPRLTRSERLTQLDELDEAV